MKLIKKEEYYAFSDYYYPNGKWKRVYCVSNEIHWGFSFYSHKEDGTAIENCNGCINNKCLWRINPNNKCKKHFWLKNRTYYPIEFADLTNHKICLNCNNFCKQECFIEEK